MITQLQETAEALVEGAEALEAQARKMREQAQVLVGQPKAAPAAAPPVERPRRLGPPKRTARRKATGRGRPPGSGERANQALALIESSGEEGASINELAERMGIKPNYLYRVVPALVQDGKVREVNAEGKRRYVTASS